eukprot:1894749-Rhodomonas_salina.1
MNSEEVQAAGCVERDAWLAADEARDVVTEQEYVYSTLVLAIVDALPDIVGRIDSPLVASFAVLVIHTRLCGMVSSTTFGYEVLVRIHLVRVSSCLTAPFCPACMWHVLVTFHANN